MSRHSECYYGEYFAEYSINLCNHPKNKDNKYEPNCRKCELFITHRQHEINEIEMQIKGLKSRLAKLKGRDKQK